jgi:hypothetical protein
VIKKWARQLNGEDINHVEMMLSASRAHGIARPVSVVADAPALAFRRVLFGNMPKTANGTKPVPEDSADEFLDPRGTRIVERQVATAAS